MDWPTFDWQGYLEVEARMIEFGSQCFCMYYLLTRGRRYLTWLYSSRNRM
jgi:hypothetical protein